MRIRVLGVCGSLQQRSSNMALLQLARRFAGEGLELQLFEGLRELPHFDPDLESGGTLPIVDAWRAAIASSDALLIVCPEYGHSLPGVVKNAIDWVIGTGELEEKRVAITASVPGPLRGRKGLEALRVTLGAVSAQILGGEPIVRGEGEERAVLELLKQIEDACR